MSFFMVFLEVGRISSCIHHDMVTLMSEIFCSTLERDGMWFFHRDRAPSRQDEAVINLISRYVELAQRLVPRGFDDACGFIGNPVN